MKRVIVNADDFGLCAGVNEGIIRAHREGVLTSASLMTNTPGFEMAVRMTRENPALAVGVHLNLVRGIPVLSPAKIPSLLRSDGYFRGSVFPVIFGLWRKKVSIEEVEKEWRAQIEKALAAGLELTHLDSEKHLHTFPPLFHLTLKLAAEYRISRVRWIRERCLCWPPGQTLKAWIISRWCSRLKPVIEGMGVRTVDHFFGFCQAGKVSASWLRKVLEHLPEGTSEIMTHPGYLTPELLELEKKLGSYYINKRRELELEALLAPDLRRLMEKEGIQLISYKEL